MNETVREILNKSKHDFLVAHGLYTKEYAPYKVRIVGYDADNPNSSDLVEYVVYSKKKMAKNDIITITYKGVNKKIKFDIFLHGLHKFLFMLCQNIKIYL